MTPTELMRNFRDLLGAIVLYLLRAGIERGSDEWEDLVEVAFDTAVLSSFRRERGWSSTWRYGVWHIHTETGGQIAVTIPPHTPLLVGEPSVRKEEGVRVTYQSWVAEKSLMFLFREFGHPFLPVSDSRRWDHVLGETFIALPGLGAGTRICAPVEVCEFSLMRSEVA